MADDIILNLGAGGPSIATDSIGNRHFQIVKQAFGADNTATLVSASNPLPVAVISVPANTALAAGNNTIGAVKIDQTATGTSNAIHVLAAGGIGSLTETAPTTDNGASGINGRLQRIAARLTSLIALLPASLGIKTAANSLSIAPASDAIFAAKIDQTTDGTTNAVSLKSTFAVSNTSNVAYATSLVVKATAGKLFKISGYNSKASAQFIQLHDAASLPANTAVPKLIISVPASSNFEIDFGQYGRSFATGIVVANSSTGPTLTIGSADIFVDAQYI
jgi:hypothetical protein